MDNKINFNNDLQVFESVAELVNFVKKIVVVNERTFQPIRDIPNSLE